MKLFQLIVLANCLALGLFSCSEEVTTKDSESEEVGAEKPDLHLKEMMRLMFNDMLVNREKILNDEETLHFSFDYPEMFSAEATTPGNVELPFYKEQMQKFLDLKDKISKVRSTIERAELFDEMKNTCVSCHQEYCIGPLRKIKKIHLIENELLKSAQFQEIQE